MTFIGFIILVLFLAGLIGYIGPIYVAVFKEVLSNNSKKSESKNKKRWLFSRSKQIGEYSCHVFKPEILNPNRLLKKHSPLFLRQHRWVNMKIRPDQGAPLGNLSGIIIGNAPGEGVRLYKFFSLETHLPKMFWSSPVACILYTASLFIIAEPPSQQLSNITSAALISLLLAVAENACMVFMSGRWK